MIRIRFARINALATVSTNPNRNAKSYSKPKKSQAAFELDAEGWSALHHALDATTYCYRAVKVSHELLQTTPPRILNSLATGSQPRGYSCLHFAAEGSDRSYAKAELCRKLVYYRADSELKTDKGNTAYMLAAATGVIDVVEALIECRADINATNNRGLNAYQSASASSGTTWQMLKDHGVSRPDKPVESARQWTGRSESRQTRMALGRSTEWKKAEWNKAGWEEAGWEAH